MTRYCRLAVDHSGTCEHYSIRPSAMICRWRPGGRRPREAVLAAPIERLTPPPLVTEAGGRQLSALLQVAQVPADAQPECGRPCPRCSRLGVQTPCSLPAFHTGLCCHGQLAGGICPHRWSTASSLPRPLGAGEQRTLQPQCPALCVPCREEDIDWEDLPQCELPPGHLGLHQHRALGTSDRHIWQVNCQLQVPLGTPDVRYTAAEQDVAYTCHVRQSIREGQRSVPNMPMQFPCAPRHAGPLRPCAYGADAASPVAGPVPLCCTQPLFHGGCCRQIPVGPPGTDLTQPAGVETRIQSRPLASSRDGLSPLEPAADPQVRVRRIISLPCPQHDGNACFARHTAGQYPGICACCAGACDRECCDETLLSNMLAEVCHRGAPEDCPACAATPEHATHRLYTLEQQQALPPDALRCETCGAVDLRLTLGGRRSHWGRMGAPPSTDAAMTRCGVSCLVFVTRGQEGHPRFCERSRGHLGPCVHTCSASSGSRIHAWPGARGALRPTLPPPAVELWGACCEAVCPACGATCELSRYHPGSCGHAFDDPTEEPHIFPSAAELRIPDSDTNDISDAAYDLPAVRAMGPADSLIWHHEGTCGLRYPCCQDSPCELRQGHLGSCWHPLVTWEQLAADWWGQHYHAWERWDARSVEVQAKEALWRLRIASTVGAFLVRFLEPSFDILRWNLFMAPPCGRLFATDHDDASHGGCQLPSGHGGPCARLRWVSRTYAFELDRQRPPCRHPRTASAAWVCARAAVRADAGSPGGI